MNTPAYADPAFHAAYNAGDKLAVIAERFGVGLRVVEYWIRRATADGMIESRLRATRWSPDKEAELVRLWGQGVGPTEISRRIKKTRSAIRDKVFALGLPAHPKPERKAKAAVVEQPKKAPKPKPTVTLWDKTEASRPFLERTAKECAWPLGERGSYHACCQPVRADGDSYCAHHRAIAGGEVRPLKPAKTNGGFRRGPASVFDKGRMAA